MTKAQVKELKKWFEENGVHYPTYYKSKEETLIVTVYEWGDFGSKCNWEVEAKCISTLLNLVSKKMRPRYEIRETVYQGFIHRTSVRFC